MNYRTATVLATKDLGTTGTEPIEIKVTDIISRLIITFYTTKASEGMSAPTHKNIPKIELVDGSDVLHSMNGGENQALCIFDRKCPTMSHGQHLSSNSEFDVYGIDFGRYLYDPLLALDPKRFKNLVLNITWDEDVADTSATVNGCAVLAECFDQKVVNPLGFLMSKEHWNAAKPTSGYEYITLPTDYPIRKLLIQPYKAAYEPWYQVAEARLDEDNEKRIPFDWDLETYTRIRKSIDPPVIEEFQGLVQSGTKTYYVTPTTYYPQLTGNDLESQTTTAGISGRGGQIVLTRSGDWWFYGRVIGWLPNHCIQFPFGDQTDPTDWYDVTKVSNLRLRLKAGSGASTTTGVVLQQLRKY